MNAVMTLAKTFLLPSFASTGLKSFLNSNLSWKPLPSLISMGNTEAHFTQLYAAKLFLQSEQKKSGFLVFMPEGEVKYYGDNYAFTVANLAAFTNMPVYCIKAVEVKKDTN